MSPLEITLQTAQGEGRAFWFLDALSIIRISGEQTGGTFALIEERLPAGRSTPYHLHHNEDETFYVLEGELSFYSESKKIVARRRLDALPATRNSSRLPRRHARQDSDPDHARGFRPVRSRGGRAGQGGSSYRRPRSPISLT